MPALGFFIYFFFDMAAAAQPIEKYKTMARMLQEGLETERKKGVPCSDLPCRQGSVPFETTRLKILYRAVQAPNRLKRHSQNCRAVPFGTARCDMCRSV